MHAKATYTIEYTPKNQDLVGHPTFNAMTLKKISYKDA